MLRSASPSLLAPIALIIGSCMSLQFGATFAVQLFPELGSWGTTAVRLTLSAAVLLAVTRPRIARWSRKQWGAVMLYGLTLGGMNGFFYAALETLPLGPAVALEFLGPLVLAAALSRRGADIAWVCVALGSMGLLAVDGLIGSDPLDPVGVALVLIAAAFWAGYIRTGARVGELVPGLGGLAVAMAIASIALLPFGVPAMATIALDPSLLPLALGMIVFASLVPYSFELLALRRLPQRVFGVLLSLEPVFAGLFGWLLLAQEPSALKAIASALIVAASIGTALGARPSRKQDVDPPTEPLPLVQ